MSTKLWNGMILRNRSLVQALSLLQGVREACLPKLQPALEEQIAQLLIFEADLPMNFHEIGGTRMWPMIFHEPGNWRQPDHTRMWPLARYELIAADRSRVLVDERPGYDWDYTFSMSLIPKENDLLALHHISNDAGYEAILGEVGFEDYHYQDQTSPPPDMPDEEWRRRRDDWIKYYWDVGAETATLNYTIVDWQDIRACPIDTDNVLAAMPKENIRRWRVAKFLIQLERALPPHRIRRGVAWNELEQRMEEVRLCEDKASIRSTMLDGLSLER